MKINQVKNLKYFSKGKRGIIYTGIYKKIKVAIKTKNPNSTAIDKIKNEAKYMQLLNKKKIGPKFIKSTNKYVMYKFVEGEFIDELFLTLTKSKKIQILKDVMIQCHILDKLGIDKEEMHHPHKHIIITKTLKPVLIDFERSHHTLKPKNVTQFVEYLRRIKFLPKKLTIKTSKQYKKDHNIKPILQMIK
tara:strand:- start:2470 stop:3039 length:570 start_codon:yes stop_codon:yes gene_type:complete